MSESEEPIEEAVETTDDAINADTPSIRLWPAVIFAIAGMGVSFYIAQFGSTNIENLIGLLVAPLSASLLLLVWWLFGSRIPVKHRFLGVVYFALLLLILCGVHGFTIDAVFLLLIVIPYFTYGVVIMLMLSQKGAWKTQRCLASIYCSLCIVVFSMLQINDMGGDLNLDLNWRWNQAVNKTTDPGLNIQATGKTADIASELSPGDWPEYRGSNRDGIDVVSNFQAEWSTPPSELWRKPVGPGWTSFVVVGNYLFTQEQRGEVEAVVCYQADTGEEIWINTIEESFEEMMGPGPRATPTFQDGKLYVQGATGIVQALDAATGESLWQRDLLDDTEAEIPIWGFSSSPLVVGNRVIVFCGGSDSSSVIAYDKATGDIAWNTGRGEVGYGSGHFTQIGDVPQVLMTSNFGVQSFVAETGEIVWEHEWIITSNPRVLQPLLTGDGGVLIGTAGGLGTRRIQVDKTEDGWDVSEKWTTKRFRPYFNDYVLYEGHCYGFDGNRLICIDVETGEVQWKGDRVGGQLLLVKNMGMLLVLTEKGELRLVKAQPDEFVIESQFQAIEGKTWNHPVIAHGRLYVRNSQEMACFELTPAP